MARLPIVLASIALSASFALPAFAVRSSGRAIDKTDAPTSIKQNPNMSDREGVPYPSYGSGSRVKPSDRLVLTKEGFPKLLTCMIWEQQGDMPAADYARFVGTSDELDETLSNLRSWHPASTWGCD